MAGLSASEIASPIRGILAEQENVRVVLGAVVGVDLEANGARSRRPKAGRRSRRVTTGSFSRSARGAATSGTTSGKASRPGSSRIEDALEIRRRVLLAFEQAERTEDERERNRAPHVRRDRRRTNRGRAVGAIAELSRFVLAKDFGPSIRGEPRSS